MEADVPVEKLRGADAADGNRSVRNTAFGIGCP